MRLLQQGQRVLLGNDAYGGTFRLISKVWEPLGFPWTAVDLGDLDAVVADWPDDTGLVWLETPTNPLLTCFDIEAIAEIAHAGARWWSSTTRSPRRTCSSRSRSAPTSSLHSATKYLGGHSDVVGGFLAVDDDEVAERLRFTQNAAGAVPSPFDCYLVLRGPRRSACGWTATARTPAPSSTCWPRTPPSIGCCTRSCPITPGTLPPPSRCATTAAWSASP